MQMGLHNTSMSHVGMTREAMKEAVTKKLKVGQKYQLKSVNATKDEKPVAAVCELMSFSTNSAIFKHRNGTLENLTYQELWTQIMDGDLL